MALLVRYRVSFALALAAVAGAASVFLFAWSELRRDDASKMFELADVPHYLPAEVKAAFAKQGLLLRYDNAPSEPLWLSSRPGPWNTSAFYVVVVTARKGTMSWGREPEEQWEARLGNVLVHYGGGDDAFLARVEAAVDELD